MAGARTCRHDRGRGRPPRDSPRRSLPSPSVVALSRLTLPRPPTSPSPVLIVDEVHHLKNESGGLHRSLSRMKANLRLLLTGTPLQNNLHEL